MASLIDFYDLAQEKQIDVSYYPIGIAKSFSAMDSGGDCSVLLDPGCISGETEELCCLAEEIGHCVTGSFYNSHSPLDVRAKHENRARRWAAKALISRQRLMDALRWDEPHDVVAEELGVTLDVLHDALAVYFGTA